MCTFIAIDTSGRLTDFTGLKMAEFPLEPMMAKMLLSSNEFKVNYVILVFTCIKYTHLWYVFSGDFKNIEAKIRINTKTPMIN